MLLVAQAVIEATNHCHSTQHPPKIVKIKSTLVPEPDFICLGQITAGLFICLLDIVVCQLLSFDLLHSLLELFDFLLLVFLIVLLNIEALSQHLQSSVKDLGSFNMPLRVYK